MARLLPRTTKQTDVVLSAAALACGLAKEDRRKLGRLIAAIEVAKAVPDRKLQRRIANWLDAAAERPADTTYALEALAWAAALPRLRACVAEATWEALFERLMRDAAEAAALGIDSHPLVHQLLAGELPLRLALAESQSKAARKLAASGRAAAIAGISELLDGCGVPHARYLPIVRLLAACWTRVRQLHEAAPGSAWPATIEREYQRFIAVLLRLSRPDGKAVFDFGDTDCELFDAALACGGEAAGAVAKLVFADKAAKRRQKTQTPLSVYGEWAALAAMRAGWECDAARLTVAFPARTALAELAIGNAPVLSGLWSCEVSVNGIPAVPTNDWEEICWEADDDVDYLELEIDLSEGVRLQRHILLARQDGFALLADAVLGHAPAQLDYCGRLPLSAGVTFRGAGANTEGMLVGKRPLARVLPLALPEWRDAAGACSLRNASRHLELRQAAVGRSLFAPLWIDLDRKRLRSPVTWRTLTIGESLKAVPSETAAGYRVAAGRQQWLVYRALGRKGNRTLLGHNLSSETLVARFDDGAVTPLIEIE